MIDLIEDPNRLDAPTTTDPIPAVAGFRILPPIPARRASFHAIPIGDSTLEFSWAPDLGSLHPVAPIELTPDRWSTSSSLVCPSMDPLAMLVWNEGREVKIPQPEASCG